MIVGLSPFDAVTPSGKRLDVDIAMHISVEGPLTDFMLVNVTDVTERQRLATALEEERILYHTLVDAIPDGVYLMDRDLRFRLANDAYANLLGAPSASSVLGKQVGDFRPKEFAQRINQENGRILETGEPVINQSTPSPVTSRHRTKLVTRVPLRDQTGAITSVIGVLRDVTALKDAEDALRASEERYRTVYENAPIGIFHTTPGGKLIDANLYFAEMMGYATSRDLMEAINAGSIANLYRNPARRDPIAAEALASRERRPYEGEYVRRDGNVGYARMVLRSYLPHGQGAPVIEGFVEDLTAQKAVERDLARERTLLTTLMETIPDRIYFKDRDGRYILVNRAFSEVGGFDSAQAVEGKIDADLYEKRYAREVRTEQLSILESGSGIINNERQEVWRNGKKLRVAVTELPFHDDAAELSGTVGISRDITQRRQMQQSLTKAQGLESVALFATGIAHRFNNLNTVISGYLQIAIANEAVPTDVRTRLAAALTAVERAVDISGKLEVLANDPRNGREAIDFVEVLAPLVDARRVGNQSATVSYRREIEPVPPVIADRSAIEVVATAPLSNADHAVIDSPEKEIVVRTVESPGWSGVEVRDTGCGVASEDLPKIFTPFYTTKGEWARGGTGLSRVGGIGLSLAVSRSLLSSFDGSIEVESELGNGTTVTIWLPCARHGPAQPGAG